MKLWHFLRSLFVRPPEGPEDTTVPAPKDPGQRLAHDVAELSMAAVRLGEALANVQRTLTQIKIAELTVEHKTNTQREQIVKGGRWIVDHERRLRALELPTAAE